jgi:SAM-dependent methyltransferase
MAIVGGMRQEDIWDIDAAQRYDTPGTGMFAPEILGPAVDRLAELAGDGPALEFAIGTGRVAIPLAERGVPVTGIELSPPMVDQLRTKADDATIPVIVGDMTTAVAPGKYTLVYLVFNIWPAELDLMAELAGFELETRHADWSGADFTAESRSHVSVYHTAQNH